MSNLGLYEADPVAWRSMGALSSTPLDARAALCCGRCRSRTPSAHPDLCVAHRGWGWERHSQTAVGKGGGTPQRWVMVLPASQYRIPKLNARQIQARKAFLLLFLALSKKR